MTEHSQETKIAILEAKVEHMMGHVKELTLRVRANEKVVASVSLLGVIACTFIGAGYFAPKAEACSPRMDGEPTYCPPWDDLAVCLSLDCPRLPITEPTKNDQVFEDDLNPNAFNSKVTLYDTRMAHMGHSFPTAGEWIQKVRDHEAKKTRTDPEDSINNALANMEDLYGSDDPTKQEELLQLPSN